MQLNLDELTLSCLKQLRNKIEADSGNVKYIVFSAMRDAIELGVLAGASVAGNSVRGNRYDPDGRGSIDLFVCAQCGVNPDRLRELNHRIKALQEEEPI